jgi:pimeloyl-ACP methyl ester carboxylesterase
VITDVATANGIQIAYDAFGNPADPAVILVMGLATQRLAWGDEFCEDLARAGRFVVRFDNRDAGESTHFHEHGEPTLLDLVRRRPPPYRIDDMADDVIGLIDALGLGTVHVVGASMGGFIAQTVAIRYPQRVHTLTLVMTSTGSVRVGRPAPAVVLRFLRRRAAADRAAAIEETIRTFRVIGSPGFPTDEDRIRQLAGASYDRAYDPAGAQRQLAAILAQPNRTARLRRLTVPTLVMHGLDDPLVSPSGGLAIARAIPSSKFVGFSGMGHDLPPELWPAITDEIIELTASAPAASLAATAHRA